MTEARLDLHVHTCHSEDRERIDLPHGASITFPFHPTLTPVEVYDLALERGMTHVTFTDHDTIDGCLELYEQHPNPDRFIAGQELTCYHQDMVLHLGVYGLTEEDHHQLHRGADRTDAARQCLRWNLRELLQYLDERGLVYDWKHPLWCRNGHTPTRAQLLELFELLPLVEGINGTRHRRLSELTYSVGRRVAVSGRAFTGGSDSHTDHVGRAYTRTWGDSPEEVLDNLKQGHCEAVGRHGSHRLLDSDGRAILTGNIALRAGYLTALADDLAANVPVLLREVGALTTNAVIAYGVVQEFARQRSLARRLEELLEAELAAGGAEHGEAVAAPDQGGLVHGHVRRD